MAQTELKKNYDFYFAGCGNKSVEKTIRENNCKRLLSWVNERKVIEERASKGYPTFVDSGAFSAFTKGINIDIDEYIDWINRWHQNLELYACWDVIPSDTVDPVESAKKTWENFQYMKARLQDPSKLVYCFHYGEDISYLKEAIGSGLTFIALGGLAKRGKKQREEFLTAVQPIFEENPQVHVHAFGVGAVNIIQQFHFIHSSDSTTPFFPPKHGRIQTDCCGLVYFGDDIEKHKKDAYSCLPTSHQMLIEQEVASRGFTMLDMQGNIGRSDWQILYWNEKMKKIQR